MNESFYYPHGMQFPTTADHLLFDVGYGHALIFSCRETLVRWLIQQADPSTCLDRAEAKLIEETQDLIRRIDAFRTHRLNVISEIYAAAEQAAHKGAKDAPTPAS